MFRFSYLDVLNKFILKTKPPEKKADPLPETAIIVPGRGAEGLPMGVPVKLPAIDEPEWVWVNLRDEPRTKPRGESRARGESRGYRSWKKVTGITLHQTAADFGTNAHRLLNVPVHGATLKDGKIVLLHDPTAYMWHAHSLNKYDLGIEVSCRAAGIEGNELTSWMSKREKEKGLKPVDICVEATDIQLEATKELIRYYVNLVKENGGEIKYLHAHRQGHKSRVSDPGSRIWKNVAIPIMDELGLKCGPIGWKVGSGTPIPEAWDEANGKGVDYNWRIKADK
jgi:hypothetical protein